jgi:hypothetical protein
LLEMIYFYTEVHRGCTQVVQVVHPPNHLPSAVTLYSQCLHEKHRLSYSGTFWWKKWKYLTIGGNYLVESCIGEVTANA